jgi:hypothetical protein
MNDDFRKKQLEDCGLTKGSKRVGPEPIDDMTYCGLNERPKREREPEPAGRPAGAGEDLIKGYDEQARAYRAFTNPLGESSPSTQGERIRALAGMILDRIAAIKKQIQEQQDGQKGPYGEDMPPLRGQDLGEWFHDREEDGSNDGAEEPTITEQGDRTRSFAIGTHVRTVDRYKVRGVGIVVSSKDGITTVDWGNGDEETYNSWELVQVEPVKPTEELDIATKAFADGDMSKTGL